MKNVHVLVIFLFSLLFFGCGKSDTWVQKIDGVYYGQMWSGGGELGCTTRFSVGVDGKLSGTYMMMEPLRAEEGVIDKCEVIKENEIHCKWRDRYGFGDMMLTFSKDKSNFSGRWNDEGKHKQNFVWRGSRNSSHIKLAEMAIKSINIDESLNKIVIYHFNQIGNIYPIVKRHKKVFFDYYRKYLSLNGVEDDLISFCITQFSQKKLHKINQKSTKKVQIIKKSIEFQCIVIGKSKADNHFSEFITIMENKFK